MCQIFFYEPFCGLGIGSLQKKVKKDRSSAVPRLRQVNIYLGDYNRKTSDPGYI